MHRETGMNAYVIFYTGNEGSSVKSQWEEDGNESEWKTRAIYTLSLPSQFSESKAHALHSSSFLIHIHT